MKIRRLHIIIVAFTLISLFSCNAQKESISSNSTIVISDAQYDLKGNYVKIYVDKLDNIYLLNDQNEIEQRSPQMDLLFKNSFRNYGTISHLDVSNPQKILVYFSDFQFILFLDNTLSEIKKLNLEDLGYWDIKAVALSVDNFIWIYDPVNFKLIKINDSGKILLSSNEQFSGDTNAEYRIHAYNNKVYLYSSNTLILFNDFGEFLSNEKMNNSNIQFYENYLLERKGSKLNIRQLDNLVKMENDQVYEILIAPKVIDFKLSRHLLYLIDDIGLSSQEIN